MKPKKAKTPDIIAVAREARVDIPVALEKVNVIPHGRGSFCVIPVFTGTTRPVASFWKDVSASDVPRIKKAIEDGKAVTRIVRKVDPTGKVYAQFQSTVHMDGGSHLFDLDLNSLGYLKESKS